MAAPVKHAHLYQTKQAHDADYTRSSENYVEPWVGYVTATQEVSYNLPCGEYCNYLTLTARAAGTFTLTIPAQIDDTKLESVSYSTDGGETWTTTQNTSSEVVITTPTIQSGNNVLWKGVGTTMGALISGTYYASTFSSTANYEASGNVMSLLNGDNFSNAHSFAEGTTDNFRRLFKNSANLLDASDMKLPATTLNMRSYAEMFFGCSALTGAPTLEATTLGAYCYNAMFQNCTTLTSGPVLPVTDLANGCYSQMFSGCSALTTAPALPATTLMAGCYSYMFQNCTALTTAPDLPATTLVSNCYFQMFAGSSNLNHIKAMFTTTPELAYTQNWVNGVAASGTFIKNSEAEWTNVGDYAVPSGWTVETAAS